MYYMSLRIYESCDYHMVNVPVKVGQPKLRMKGCGPTRQDQFGNAILGGLFLQ